MGADRRALQDSQRWQVKTHTVFKSQWSIEPLPFRGRPRRRDLAPHIAESGAAPSSIRGTYHSPVSPMATLLNQRAALRPFGSASGLQRRCAGLSLRAAAPRAPRTLLRVRADAGPQQQQQPAAGGAPPAAAAAGERKVVYNTEFGHSRKDIFLIGGGLIGLGYAMYYGLQATGMEPGIAGNWVQAIIFLGICVGYISTYLYRVATKQMTYAKQLEMYEEAVIQKRMEEMTEAEVGGDLAPLPAPCWCLACALLVPGLLFAHVVPC
ncbi:MAG: hypothetical protein J3K34DRAFT_29041 [Monoraphidium minutum]|nr:MAG: hypothetical protein J3K34DRAFT_29041 [Monoraphidium minutum]